MGWNQSHSAMEPYDSVGLYYHIIRLTDLTARYEFGFYEGPTHFLGLRNCTGTESNLLECQTVDQEVFCPIDRRPSILCGRKELCTSQCGVDERVAVFTVCTPTSADHPTIRLIPAFLDSEISLEVGRRFVDGLVCDVEGASGSGFIELSLYKDGVFMEQSQQEC